MKNLKDIITERLNITNNVISERLVLSKNSKPRTKIPDSVSGVDNKIFNRIYNDLKDMANRLNLDADSDDLSKLETYINHYLPKSLRTKEKIWAFINCTLGYDYMFDDSDMDNWEEGYLHPDWEDADPIYELAYRAAEAAHWMK